MNEEELPEGWAAAQVSELMDLMNGFAFKPAHWKGEGLPIIRIQNLNNPGATFNHCPDALPEKYRVRNGDLLFAWSGTPGTSFGAHIWKGGDAWLNQHIFRVVFPVALLDKQFLRHAINQNLEHYIDKAHGGAGLAHITKGMFDSSHVLIPPLAEQHRIVTAVERALAKVNAARDRLARVPATLKRFRQAVLAAACSGRLTADSREGSTAEVWEEGPLRDYCEIIGGSQPDKKHFIYEPRDGYIRLIQIRDYKSDRHLTFIPRELARRFCTADDVMIGRYGPPLFQILRGLEGSYNVALMKAVPQAPEMLLNDFLFILLQNPPLREDVIQFSERTV